jgi:hypothetical protein
MLHIVICFGGFGVLSHKKIIKLSNLSKRNSLNINLKNMFRSIGIHEKKKIINVSCVCFLDTKKIQNLTRGKKPKNI